MNSYSKRLSWNFSPNAFSRLIEEKRRARISLIDLTISNPTETLPEYPHHSIHRALSNIQDFRYQPNPFGQEAARYAICDYYRQHGISVSTGRIALTASTSEAYALLFKMFCDPGDEILVPVPSYPLFEYLALLESVRPVPYPLLYDGSWFVDFNELGERLSPRTRAIIIVNPNNPTGSFLKAWEAERLIALAHLHKLPIISDEVFLDYTLASAVDQVSSFIGNESVLSFSLAGLSKSAGMPQMKLAWIVIDGPPSETAIARQRLELVLDTYLPVTLPVQSAAADLLNIGAEIRQQILETAGANLRNLQSILKNSPAHVLRAEGGWSAVVQVPRTWSEQIWITRLLEEQGVIVQPGYFFDMASEAYLVVSLITRPAEFAEGIDRLRITLTQC